MSSCSFSVCLLKVLNFPSNSTLSHLPMEATSVSGSPSTLTEDDNFSVSFEGSSCPTDTQVDLGLALSLGLKGPRGFEVSSVEDSSSSSSSSVSSLTGIKRRADSMDMTNGHVVGWPPIRTYRMNSMVNQVKTLATGELNNRRSMFVKVTMDGIPIGRKIDLNVHRSYDSLSRTLEGMFLMKLSARPIKLQDASSEFVLTYKDKEGDWMLVGDVPWGMFVGSVRRLRIMTTSEATGRAQTIT